MPKLVDMLEMRLNPIGAVSKKMFGGVAFMLSGNMVAGTFRDGVLFRAGPGFAATAAERPEAKPMEMNGRIAAGYWIVPEAEIDSATFDFWLDAALAFNATLPPKAEGVPKKPMARKKA